MAVYRRSVTNCVSFPSVVYFYLFSPLKDRYAFSICLQLLGLRPQIPTGALPLNRERDPAGDLSSPDPLFCPPSKFLATPLCCIIQIYMPTCSRKLAVHVAHTVGIFLLVPPKFEIWGDAWFCTYIEQI